jgi:predicted ATPase
VKPVGIARTELRLGPLDAVGTAALAGQIADGRLDAERAARLYRETEGFPLFIVESVRGDLPTRPAGEEKPAEVAGARASSLPPKVHALIMQRLGQLSSAARDLAGVCATVGRAFTLDVLRRTLTQDDEVLAGALDELARRGIVREQSLPGAYDFSHDRIREVVYDALGEARRQLLHRRIAETLVEMRAGDLDRASAEVAAHFEHGGCDRALHAGSGTRGKAGGPAERGASAIPPCGSRLTT